VFVSHVLEARRITIRLLVPLPADNNVIVCYLLLLLLLLQVLYHDYDHFKSVTCTEGVIRAVKPLVPQTDVQLLQRDQQQQQQQQMQEEGAAAEL
jgi:hypothetical protein